MLTVMNDAYYMQFALDMASKASGQTDINPVVGCVVVQEGRIVGMGAHLKRGEGHAEVHALNMAGEAANGATVYVTLEPCSYYGLTSPCVDRLLAAKVAKVIVATVDPNPLVAGRGIAKLKEHGINVEVGLLGEQSRLMNEKFNKWITTKRPFVTLKSASTLDGKIATHTGHSKWVTGPEAREQGHTLRHQHSAIMVGIETILTDNPSLTMRGQVPGLHPIRIIVDSKLRLPSDATVVTDRTSETWVLTTAHVDEDRCQQLTAAGIKILTCGDGDRVNLKLAMKALGECEIGSVLLEGGGQLNGSMLEEGLIDKIYLYFAPKIIGGSTAPVNFSFSGFESMTDAIQIQSMQVDCVGSDIRISGYPDHIWKES